MLSFTDYNVLANHGDFIGLDNFQRMFFEDRRYWRSVNATLKYVIFSVPLRLVFALAVAMLLNTYRRGVGVYRAAFYAPSIIGGSIAVAVMWREIFGNDGLVNFTLNLLGIQGPLNWLGRPETAIWTLIILAAWQFGSPMLIFLAGLKNIPKHLYEAAEIDGANALQRFLRITLPMLTPIIFFNLIMQIDLRLHGFHPSVYRHARQAAGYDAVLRALCLSARLRRQRDGICLGYGLDHAGRHRLADRAGLPLLKLLGSLRIRRGSLIHGAHRSEYAGRGGQPTAHDAPCSPLVSAEIQCARFSIMAWSASPR